jgi:NAD+ kinase
MKRIGVSLHPGKPAACKIAIDLVNRLEKAGVEVELDQSTASVIARPELKGDLLELDACIVLGGDGAFLRAGKKLAKAGIPMLGINLGSLGFLSEIEPSNLNEAVDRLLAGEYRIQQRLMLEAQVLKNGEVTQVFEAINDIVMARGTLARAVHYKVYVGESLAGSYRGDGVIISTPTGSTAYSLSAGGPVVHPDVDALVITHVCPHTLGARSLVVSVNEEVYLEFDHTDEDLYLTSDGHSHTKLSFDELVRVKAGKHRAKLIYLYNRTFIDVLQTRMARQFGQNHDREG